MKLNHGRFIHRHGSGGLSKDGAGSLTLSGDNSYTGPTLVNAGTLALVGGSQAFPITIGGGATLGFVTGSPASSTSTVTFTGATAKVSVSGTSTATTLMTASNIIGTPILDPAIPGYALVIDGGGASLKQISTSGSDYDSWATPNGIPGQAANLDHDGIPNGIEYFIGGPTGNTTGFTALPGITNIGATQSITWTKAGDYSGTYGTDFIVETSTTLATGSWSPETLGVTVSISGNDVTYTFPAGPVRFARLKVIEP